MRFKDYFDAVYTLNQWRMICSLKSSCTHHISHAGFSSQSIKSKQLTSHGFIPSIPRKHCHIWPVFSRNEGCRFIPLLNLVFLCLAETNINLLLLTLKDYENVNFGRQESWISNL